jgi:hypothetical protein
MLLAMLVAGCSRKEPIERLMDRAGHEDDSHKPIFFTNKTAIANGRVILSAVRSSDTRSKPRIQALIGSEVVFVGEGDSSQGNFDLRVRNGALIEVEMLPTRDARQNCCSWTAEVLGTLKSVDFEKHVIQIQTKPEHWIITASL